MVINSKKRPCCCPQEIVTPIRVIKCEIQDLGNGFKRCTCCRKEWFEGTNYNAQRAR